jgi:uncharacterized membrane protein (DUF106 family)
MAFLEGFLNPVLDPLLNLGPFWAIVVISLVISLLITLIYKLVTNQKKMRELKTEMKDSQKKMKELKDQPEKVMAMQKAAMKKNLEYMKHSFKPTLITFIPIILIFGWLQGSLAFEPIMPGQDFTVMTYFEDGAEGMIELVVPEEGVEILGEASQEADDEVEWKLKATAVGGTIIDFDYNDQIYPKEILVTEDYEYEEAVKKFEGDLNSIEIKYEKLKPLGDFSIFGWHPGWLGLYIIFSLVFSMSLRKIFKLA